MTIVNYFINLLKITEKEIQTGWNTHHLLLTFHKDISVFTLAKIMIDGEVELAIKFMPKVFYYLIISINEEI